MPTKIDLMLRVQISNMRTAMLISQHFVEIFENMMFCLLDAACLLLLLRDDFHSVCLCVCYDRGLGCGTE